MRTPVQRTGKNKNETSDSNQKRPRIQRDDREIPQIRNRGEEKPESNPTGKQKDAMQLKMGAKRDIQTDLDEGQTDYKAAKRAWGRRLHPSH